MDDLFERIQESIDEIRKEHELSVPLGELLNNGFISENSRFSTLTDFLKGGGFDVDSVENFKATPPEALYSLIKARMLIFGKSLLFILYRGIITV